MLTRVLSWLALLADTPPGAVWEGITNGWYWSVPGGGAPEWMTTYADLVTLLMAFFVARWNRLHAHAGKPVVILDGDTALHRGVAAGIDDNVADAVVVPHQPRPREQQLALARADHTRQPEQRPPRLDGGASRVPDASSSGGSAGA